MVTIGDVTAVVGSGLSCRGLLLLLLNWLQGITLVDSGHSVVAPFVEHLPHLACSEGRRQITTATSSRTGRRRVATDGGGTDCAATSSTVLMASYRRG